MNTRLNYKVEVTKVIVYNSYTFNYFCQIKNKNTQSINNNLVCKIYFFLIIFFNLNLFAQKQIAITIDDPNTYETQMLTWQEQDNSILKALDEHKIKAALFVCGMRVNDTNGSLLLNKWDGKNHLICNHSYSHFNFNSRTKNASIFNSDFQKCDSIIKKYKNYSKLFRFPYLKEGNTATKRDSMRDILSSKGYKSGYVTIDASDWYINSEITKALTKDINADLIPYKDYYIKHILDRANYYDSIAHTILKKDIKHTLLIHHSLLNALFLDDLLLALKKEGWKLIDAKKAYNHNFDLKPTLIEPCGESIIWQYAKLNKKVSLTLRYPAEDDEYEKEPLEKYIHEYNINNDKNAK